MMISIAGCFSLGFWEFLDQEILVSEEGDFRDEF